jgi:hypothetical protein
MTDLNKKGLGLLKVAAKIAAIFVVIVSVFAFTRSGGLREAAIVTSPEEVAQPPEAASPISAVAAPADTVIEQ